MSIKKSAGVCVISQGKSFLLAKRPKYWGEKKIPVPFPEHWSIFCGAMEGNETPAECAVRELYEESKIKISVEDLEYAGHLKNFEKNIFHLHFCNLNYLPNVSLNAEHTAYMWWSVELVEDFPYKIEEKLFEKIKKHLEKYK